MRRLSKNFISLILSDVVRRILGFLAVAYLARKVGASGFGAVNIGFTVLSYALMTSTAGLNTFGTRKTALGISNDDVGTLVGLRLITALLTFFVVSLIAVMLVPNATMSKLIIVFCLSLFANALLVEWFFQGKEEMLIVGIGRVTSTAIYLLLLLGIVRSADDIIMVAIAAIAGDFVAASLLFTACKRRIGAIPIRLAPQGWKTIILSAFPLGFGSLMAHFSINLPPLVLGIMMTNSDVGLYSAASKLVFFLLMLDRVLATLLLPASTRRHEVSPETLASTLSTALKWITTTALPVSVGGSILAHQIVPIVFGQQYVEAAGVFRILVWLFFFTTLHTVYTSGMIAIGEEKVYGRVMIISAVVYAASIIACTKLFGLVGAATAVVCSEAGTLILMRNRFSSFVKIPLPGRTFNTVVSTGLMALVLLQLPLWNLFLSILIGGIVYAVALFLTRAVTHAEILSILRRV